MREGKIRGSQGFRARFKATNFCARVLKIMALILLALFVVSQLILTVTLYF